MNDPSIADWVIDGRSEPEETIRQVDPMLCRFGTCGFDWVFVDVLFERRIDVCVQAPSASLMILVRTRATSAAKRFWRKLRHNVERRSSISSLDIPAAPDAMDGLRQWTSCPKKSRICLGKVPLVRGREAVTANDWGAAIMIVWSGWGLLVIVLSIPASIVAAIVGGAVNAIIPLDKPFLASIVGAVWGIAWGISCIVVGRRINDPKKDRLLVDPKTNQKLLIKKRSTLFWIPIEYWGYPIMAATVIFVAASLWTHA